jgi:hypothetical protein
MVKDAANSVAMWGRDKNAANLVMPCDYIIYIIVLSFLKSKDI